TGPGCVPTRGSATDGARSMISAAAPLSAGGVPASRIASPVVSPAITGAIQASIPAEVMWPPDSEVRIGAPAPQPGRCEPRPTQAHTIDVLICGIGPIRAFIDILPAIGHPNPAILARINPLAGPFRSRRRGCLLLSVALAGGLQDACLIVLRRL